MIRIINQHAFAISHYSGQVKYDSAHFQERNRNVMSPELIEVMRQSQNPRLVEFFTNKLTASGSLTVAISPSEGAGKDLKRTMTVTMDKVNIILFKKIFFYHESFLIFHFFNFYRSSTRRRLGNIHRGVKCEQPQNS